MGKSTTDAEGLDSPGKQGGCLALPVGKGLGASPPDFIHESLFSQESLDDSKALGRKEHYNKRTCHFFSDDEMQGPRHNRGTLEVIPIPLTKS